MAEGLLRAIYGDRYEAFSAGIEATRVNPHAVTVMKEIGIDISGQYSKTPQEFQDIIFDVAVTVCDRAKTACSICSTSLEIPTKYPKAREIIHKNFEDPAAVVGSDEKQLEGLPACQRRDKKLDFANIREISFIIILGSIFS